MKPIRVLVTDDSAFMRTMISDMLNDDSQIMVVGTARDGKEAIKKVSTLDPDVVTLDIEMPVMDGLTTLKQLMKEHPVPVVMLSSLTKEGAENTFAAMNLGAIDFISKPSGSLSVELKEMKDEIVAKVVAAAKANVKKLIQNEGPIVDIAPITLNPLKKRSLVAIGASTGGPRALQQVLTQIPGHFPCPILIVQHMPPGFTKSLAQRLDSKSDIHVKEATDGEILQKGVAYIAPGDFHLCVRSVGRSLAIQLTNEDHVSRHRPSVDVLFESLAPLQTYSLCMVVMTGMGADGSKGIVKVKQKNPHSTVIAESQETAVVYGMPKAAVKTNVVDEVVDLNNISKKIIAHIEKS
jgi:two-component system chemotaxis response regulator CheB